MASIQELYEYPFRGANEGETWNPNRPMQQWSRPLEAGEDPNEVIQLWTYVAVSPSSTEAVRVGFFMTKLDASSANVIAFDDPENKAHTGDVTAYWSQPPVAIPMRELAENESLANTPFGLVLTVM